MKIDRLSERSIKAFSGTLRKAGVKSNAMEIFFDTITDLIDPYEMCYSQNMQIIMEQCHFHSDDEAATFLQRYNDFTNSAIGFIDAFADIEDNDQFDREVEPMFNALYHADEKNFTILIEKIDQLLFKTIEVYEIGVEKLASTDDVVTALEPVLGSRGSAFQMTLLMSIVTAMRDGKVEHDDQVTLRANFIMTTSFVAALNALRKEELDRIKDDSSFVPRSLQNEIEDDTQSLIPKVGRNDPCPCGSGKKYKKCCMNKSVEKKSDPLEALDLPMAPALPLSRKQIDDFYALWSRLIHFADKTLCERSGQKFEKSYLKDDDGKYTLTEAALKDNHYLDLRGFLLVNFDRIIDSFIDETKVSKANIDILMSWKEQRLYAEDFFIYEKVPYGALVWDVRGERYFYIYDLYDSIYDLSKNNTALSMLLLPYKGRMIYDGVLAHMSMDFGHNMIDRYLNEYVSLRQKSALTSSLPNVDATTKIYRLKISIKGAKPPIWRRVLLEDDLSLLSLHRVIQDIFEWQDSHLYAFSGKHRSYMDKAFEDPLYESESADVSLYTVGDELKAVGDKLTYVYDFGDDWEHVILLEEILEKEEGEYYPQCIKGRGMGPIEDTGGIWVHNTIVDAYKRGDKETLAEYYVYDSFDPTTFSVDAMNRRLRGEV